MEKKAITGDLRKRLRGAVKDILKGADMNLMTEREVRSTAAERIGVDPNLPELKKLVSKLIVELVEVEEEGEEENAVNVKVQVKEENEIGEEENAVNVKVQVKEENEIGEEKKPEMKPNCDDNILCQLSAKRLVSIQNFKGKSLVSIREYYEKDGKLLPSTKGISLTSEQWQLLKDGMPAITQAIQKLQE